jgi:predicted transcriptional regulator
MTTIAIQLPDEQAERLDALAQRLQVSVEQLATASVLGLLSKPDEEFNRIADEIFRDYAELYRRLA